MQTYRILYLRENKLEHSQALPADLDLLEAIDVAIRRPAGVTAEIWSDQGKVGIVGPSPAADSGAEKEREAEVTEEMRARLRLVRDGES